MKNDLSVTSKKIDLFVPGRLCLFGEHSDWAGQMRKFNAQILPGYALVVCTNEGIYAEVEASDTLNLTSLDNENNRITAKYDMDSEQLQKAADEGGFFSYVAGVALYMLNHYRIGGLSLNCKKMTLPQKKGLSSSAAICTLTARAFNRIYGLNLTVRGEMEAAYGGEQLTPSRCGRLDQAVAFGRGIVDMRFNGDRLDVKPVKIGATLHFVFADLNTSKDTIAILQNLNTAYPFSRTSKHKNLQRLLGEINTQIVAEAVDAIACGDANRIGELMILAQDNFDRYAMPLSPVELEAPVLHNILSDKKICEFAYGGKGVGSQGDGSVQFIAKSESDANSLIEYLQTVYGLSGNRVTVQKTPSVRKAVIPLAGLGTRMFPATKITNKELLPIIDIDNITKPILLILLESLIDSGIEEVCLVIRPGEEAVYKQLFETVKSEISQKLPSNLIRYNEKIVDLGSRVTYIYQNEPMGFGHAVLQSQHFAGGEPVVLMLGDHLFESSTGNSCIMQLISAYEKNETLTLGLFEILPSQVMDYGIAKTEGDNNSISAIVEKPDIFSATRNLAMDGKFYGVFMYVITAQVYEELANNMATYEDSSELQLTPALAAVAQKYGAVGEIINGKRFDVGLPQEYRRTVAEYGR